MHYLPCLRYAVCIKIHACKKTYVEMGGVGRQGSETCCHGIWDVLTIFYFTFTYPYDK